MRVRRKKMALQVFSKTFMLLKDILKPRGVLEGKQMHLASAELKTPSGGKGSTVLLASGESRLACPVGSVGAGFCR